MQTACWLTYIWLGYSEFSGLLEVNCHDNLAVVVPACHMQIGLYPQSISGAQYAVREPPLFWLLPHCKCIVLCIGSITRTFKCHTLITCIIYIYIYACKRYFFPAKVSSRLVMWQCVIVYVYEIVTPYLVIQVHCTPHPPLSLPLTLSSCPL